MPRKILLRLPDNSIAIHQGHHIMFITGFFGLENFLTFWRYNIYTEQWRKYVIRKTKAAPEQDSITTACSVAIGENAYVLESSLDTNNLLKLSQTTHGSWIWEKVVIKSGTKKPES